MMSWRPGGSPSVPWVLGAVLISYATEVAAGDAHLTLPAHAVGALAQAASTTSSISVAVWSSPVWETITYDQVLGVPRTGLSVAIKRPAWMGEPPSKA